MAVLRAQVGPRGCDRTVELPAGGLIGVIPQLKPGIFAVEDPRLLPNVQHGRTLQDTTHQARSVVNTAIVATGVDEITMSPSESLPASTASESESICCQ